MAPRISEHHEEVGLQPLNLFLTDAQDPCIGGVGVVHDLYPVRIDATPDVLDQEEVGPEHVLAAVVGEHRCELARNARTVKRG